MKASVDVVATSSNPQTEGGLGILRITLTTLFFSAVVVLTRIFVSSKKLEKNPNKRKWNAL